MKAILLLVSVALAFQAAGQEMPSIQRAEAWATPDGLVHVRWITPSPTKGEVRWGHAPDRLTEVTPEDPSSLRGTTNNRQDPGTGWANNHRADFAAGGTFPVYARITCLDRDAKQAESALLTVTGPRLPTAPGRRSGEIPLRIDSGDWALPQMPVTVGVPFAPGDLAEPSALRLLIGDEAVPLQTAVVTRWQRDGSIKWLRLDFLAPRGSRSATLVFGPPTASPQTPQNETLNVPLPTPVVTAVDGTRHLGSVDRQTLEEQGPVKTVHRLDGHHVAPDGSRLFAYTLRLHTWHGMPFSRLDYTLLNTITEPEMTSVRSVDLEFPVPDGETVTAATDADGESIALTPGTRLLQEEDFRWQGSDGSAGKRLPGVLQLPDRQVVMRHFWEQWPAAVARTPEALVLGLCPALPSDMYAGREDEDKLYYQVRDSRHTFRQGFTKTWEFWQSSVAGHFSAGLPVAAVSPAWIERSGALRRLAVAVRDQFEDYDAKLEVNIQRYPAAREQNREYGMMNFGDWHGERRLNWGNCEYDLGHAFLTQFARTGDARFWRHAEEAVRHQRDVDTRHYAKAPERVGQQWIHSVGHTAGYYPDDYKDMKLYSGRGWSDNRGHIWAQGMFEHYLLGGDRRSWDSGLLIADWAAGPQCTNFTFGNAREPGWMSKLVMSAYLATEDPFYLNAAYLMLSETHRRSLASGDHGFYYHKLPNGHCNCPDAEKHYGEAGFMLGVLMTGMLMYYEVSGDEWAADDVAKTAHFIADTLWSETDLAFHYTPCPKSSVSKGSAWIMMEGLAFGARRTGDAKLAELCRTALAAAWDALPTGGKSAGYTLCASAQALDQVAQLPGERFDAYVAALSEVLFNPVQRLLPTTVPNPDFEESIHGWPSRGWDLEHSGDAVHSGRFSLRIRGERKGQNEYINTVYDNSGSPYEITWLQPGATYRLTAWLRLDHISAGAPAPSMRIAFRDAGGTRGGAATNAYDLTQKGTWQALTATVTLPPWNTRNYLALNTNTRDAVEVDMYLDDISLVPLDQAAGDTYALVRLVPEQARRSGTTAVRAYERYRGMPALVGAGSAIWTAPPMPAGTYTLWIQGDREGGFASLSIDGRSVLADTRCEQLGWHRLGEVTLPAAESPQVTLSGISEKGALGRLVLSSDPSSSLPR